MDSVRRRPERRPALALVALVLAGRALPAAIPARAAGRPVPVAGASGDWDLARLLREVAAQDNRRRRFVERRFVSALEAPVDARGELRFVAPARLEKRTAAPYAEVLVLDGDQLSVDGPAGRATMSLRQLPEVAALVEGLRAILAGDGATLERVFATTLTGGAADWHLRLVPRDARALRLLAEIRVSGRGGELDLVETDQADGDRSVMRIVR